MTAPNQTDTADLDLQLDAYARRADRRKGRKGAAELLGYTAAAGGLAFAGGDAMGGIIHSNSTKTAAVTLNAGSFTDTNLGIDLDGDTDIDLLLRLFVGQGFFGYDIGGVGLDVNNPADMFVSTTEGFANALAVSDNLTAGLYTWYNSQNDLFRNRNGVQLANIPFGSTGYVGLRFNGTTGTPGTQYGWMKIRAEYDTTGPNHSVSVQVTHWAFEDSGGSIHFSGVPAAIPEPGTPLLALLGLGAVGVTAYRRRRDEGLKRQAADRGAA